MKKITLIFLSVIFFIDLTACQRQNTDSDSAKIQESIEKIKTKIQENLAPGKSDNTSDKGNSGSKDNSPKKNNDNSSNENSDTSE